MKNEIDKFTAVIFDLDGTLIDSMGIWQEIDIKFLNKRGIPVPNNLFDDLKSNNINALAEHFKEKFALKETIEEIVNEWIIEAKHAYEHTIKLKPGAVELLNYIKTKGKKLAIGTSNERTLTQATLKKHQIYDYFETIVCGCDCERGKPEPDIFLKIAENLKIPPHECLVMEDSLLGVKAAKNAGMTVYAFADEYAIDDKEQIIKIADKYFESF